jgi:hypothetical protein
MASGKADATGSWRGVLRDAAGNPLAEATIELTEQQSGQIIARTTDRKGIFVFSGVIPGRYSLSVHWNHRTLTSPTGVEVRADENLSAWLELAAGQEQVTHRPAELPLRAGGGERLSSRRSLNSR